MAASLRLISPGDIPRECADPVDPGALKDAREILSAVRSGGEKALRAVAERFGEVSPGEPLIAGPAELRAAFEGLPPRDRALLERTAARIRSFARAQRAAVRDTTVRIPGGEAGHTIAPVSCAGCYAPGGRYPLPSSVLMTAITARAAGVKSVWVASPKPSRVTLAAGHVAGADGLLKVGGAQAVAALAEGVCVPRADVIVGPGNNWVTAAKSLVQGQCAIDMLAGPSEVLVICDDTCDPRTVAADLLAQAEHDTASRPIVLSTQRAVIDRVNAELSAQLAALPEPNRGTAAAAVRNGFGIVVGSVDEAIRISDSIGPEHLEVITRRAEADARRCGSYGGLFIGQLAAEVLGDYGAGPNHVLPTAGTSRYTGGLSVFNFLRIRTWMRIDDAAGGQELARDAAMLARLEGLEGHARAAECRLAAKL
eukprot:TRINITY_DN55938_c0_g1_i1.p1 TRINITY_DN55938_c0_g1~~TRINITY_DN55938_c0_g1_i1.p1  ORF type:complete len:425 (+),score=145.90 TRINITY_DN55938_c0_g1_i1:77-1351(+)